LFKVLLDNLCDGLTGFGGMTTVLLLRRQSDEVLKPSNQGPQLQTLGRGPLPGLKRPLEDKVKQDLGIHRVGLRSASTGLGVAMGSGRIEDHDFDVFLSLQRQSEVETVEPRRLQSHARSSLALAQTPTQLLMSFFVVGEDEVLSVSRTWLKAYVQALGADVDTGILQGIVQEEVS